MPLIHCQDQPCDFAKARAQRQTIMLTVYADESTDEKEQRVFAVGGLMAKQEEWDCFLKEWQAIEGGIAFHGADCESGYGEYKGWPTRQRLKRYADLAKLASGHHPLLGIGAAVNLKDFWEVFPHVDRDQPYLLCFQDVVVNFAVDAGMVIPLDEVDFLFDLNLRHEFNATTLFYRFRELPNWRDSFRLHEIRFSDKRRTAGLRVADLVARETFKHLYNQLYGGPSPRLSMRALGSSKRFRFRFWIKQDFEMMRIEMQEHGWDENELAAFASLGLLRKLGRLTDIGGSQGAG